MLTLPPQHSEADHICTVQKKASSYFACDVFLFLFAAQTPIYSHKHVETLDFNQPKNSS